VPPAFTWLTTYARYASASARVLKDAHFCLSFFVTPALGHIPLARLTPDTIQGYYTGKLAAGLSPTTVHIHHRLLRAQACGAVGIARAQSGDEDEPTPPAPVQRRGVGPGADPVVPSPGEAESRYYALYLTAVLTGMRQGELLGLRWQDVDLGLGLASIQQMFYRMSGNKKQQRSMQLLFKAPKTDRSRRVPTLPQAVVTELRAIREVQAEQRRMIGTGYHDRDLVFCQPTGRPLHTHNLVRRDFLPLIKAAGLPRCRFHDLRHAHVVYMALGWVHARRYDWHPCQSWRGRSQRPESVYSVGSKPARSLVERAPQRAPRRPLL
jgi:integrase